MEELITRPIEEALAAVPGAKKISSTSTEGGSNVRVSFAWGTDLEEASNEVRESLKLTPNAHIFNHSSWDAHTVR